MEISENQKRLLIRKLLIARTRILCNHPFFGLLLMHVKFSLDEKLLTAATNGESIVFGVGFIEKISDSELDFVLMHEVLHIALKHCFRGEKFDDDLFNIACDIVVNSNILKENNMNVSSIAIGGIGVSMHLAPDGKEGFNYTAEEVYAMLVKKGGKTCSKNGKESEITRKNTKNSGKYPLKDGFDSHSMWKNNSEDTDQLEAAWTKRIADAAIAIENRANYNAGSVPMCVERLLKELREPQIDWRIVLDNFVQEEVSDYSFLPPDKRFDGDFFLPDFNDIDYKIENILFMIDTSGSMSDKMIADAYSEIYGAIEGFNGKLQGFLGFFDADVVKPEPFCDVQSLKIIKPKGGGGTNYSVVFNYIRKKMADNLPVSIVILTDGYAPFPEENLAPAPVLWVINNDRITPPWGKVARIN